MQPRLRLSHLIRLQSFIMEKLFKAHKCHDKDTAQVISKILTLKTRMYIYENAFDIFPENVLSMRIHVYVRIKYHVERSYLRYFSMLPKAS